MKTINSDLSTELARVVTRPGYLVKIDFQAKVGLAAQTLYYSTLGTVVWSGQSWMAYDIKVSGFAQDGKGAVAAKLEVGNATLAMSALALNYNTADTPVTVWACYLDLSGAVTPDPVQVFEGVIDSCEIGHDKCTFDMVAQGNKTLESPRFFINQINGFHWIKPAGSIINWGNEVFSLPTARGV